MTRNEANLRVQASLASIIGEQFYPYFRRYRWHLWWFSKFLKEEVDNAWYQEYAGANYECMFCGEYTKHNIDCFVNKIKEFKWQEMKQ